MSDTRLESVRRFRDLYRRGLEDWQVKHDDAMRSYDLAHRAGYLVFAVGGIERLDESIRESVLVRNEPCDEEAENFVHRLYAEWFRDAKRCLLDGEELERDGYPVKGLCALRHNVREVGGILTPDEDFFAGKDLQDLRDAAIDSHRNGHTQPLEN
jgi:hypothetical protein